MEHFKQNDVQSATLVMKPMFNFLCGEVAAGRMTQEEMNQRLACFVKQLPLSDVEAVDDASTDLRAVEHEELKFFVESVFNEIMEEMKNLFVDGKDEKIKYELKLKDALRLLHSIEAKLTTANQNYDTLNDLYQARLELRIFR